MINCRPQNRAIPKSVYADLAIIIIVSVAATMALANDSEVTSDPSQSEAIFKGANRKVDTRLLC